MLKGSGYFQRNRDPAGTSTVNDRGLSLCQRCGGSRSSKLTHEGLSCSIRPAAAATATRALTTEEGWQQSGYHFASLRWRSVCMQQSCA